MQRTWFITGAARGLGVAISEAVLRSGDRVIAAARSRSAVTASLGPDSEQLLSVELDVTDPAQAHVVADTGLSRFGGIDVLVNNAGYGHYGFFEESSVEDAREQIATNLFGVLYVTWAILPTMRAARRGLIFNVSSLGGLLGAQFGTLYCASKFAVEGFSESLAKEVAPFGLHVTIIEPGPFRTDFLTASSIHFGQKRIAEYDQRRSELLAGIEQRNGKQPGDPAKLADAIVTLSRAENPPLRFLAGSIAVNAADEKLASMRAELDRWRELSLSTDGNFSDASRAGVIAQLGGSQEQ